MSRWFRVYSDMVDDPKVQRLPAETFRGLVNLWCIAARSDDGRLPPLEDIAFSLRIKPQRAHELIVELRVAGLIDDEMTDAGNVTRPHNWNGRQFKSDMTGNERVKRHRNKKRNVTGNVTSSPNVTPPETETETDSSEANASGADAPLDERTKLFRVGLKNIERMTGKREVVLRPLFGRWLKAADDDCLRLNRLIEDAERGRVADPVAFIEASLKPKEMRNGGGSATRPEPAHTTVLRSIARAVEKRDRLDAGQAGSDDRVQPHGAGPPVPAIVDDDLDIPPYLRRTGQPREGRGTGEADQRIPAAGAGPGIERPPH